ncbi:MAG TPA: hypothetical protein VGR54_01345 [Nitrosopumilaceae archaeon]|nr:hypothetical protein [Nitrosopumilaceae archaeon]
MQKWIQNKTPIPGNMCRQIINALGMGSLNSFTLGLISSRGKTR